MIDNYDLCIVGGGPAGIIIALEFFRMNPSKTILIVEYGEEIQKKTNNLDDTIIVTDLKNHHLPYECTNKGLGGTTATWGGRCVMYDEIDFIPRPVLNNQCTWDILLFEEIKQFLSFSAYYFECGQPVFNTNELSAFKEKRIAERFSEEDVTDSVLERWSPPTRFGKKYRNSIAGNSNITLLQGYEARDFKLLLNDGNVSSLTLRHVKTKELTEVKAKIFVIAAGTQETTRLLLRNTQLFNSLDGPPSVLGKFYQGHLSGKIASVKFNGDPSKTEYGLMKDIDGTYIKRRFQFSKDYLLKENLLNTAIWLDNPLYYDPSHKSGAMSLMYLAMITPVLGERLAPPAIANSITKGKVHGIPKHILNIIRGFPGSILKPASIFYRRYLNKRKLPGVFLFNPQNIYALHFHSEQIPTFENQMKIGIDGETLIIDYSLTESDIQSVIKLHEKLDECLQRNNCGKLEFWFNKSDLPGAIAEMSRDGIHQSGTTRIANSQENGVVDRNLKLFGTNNVFICSSSVFPTSSQANPTFMLGAFAARLASHITKINENN